MRIFLTKKQLEQLRELYPDMATKEMSKIMGIPAKKLHGFAWRNGIKKSKEFFESDGSGRIKKGDTTGRSFRFPKGHKPANKGKKMSTELYDKIKHTFFKKGRKPHNTKSDGYLSKRKDTKSGITYIYIRVKESVWVPYHRYIWVKHNGPIPDKHVVKFIDGDQLNCSIDNLELIPMKKNMALNSILNYTEELRQIMHLIKKTEKIIKKNEQNK